jgi:hypothetical protein
VLSEESQEGGGQVSERLIQSRKARATGTVVDVVYAPDADPAQPWETICAEHGGVCSHQTRALAMAWAPHPDEWCEDCMYGEGTLAADRVPEGYGPGGAA